MKKFWVTLVIIAAALGAAYLAMIFFLGSIVRSAVLKFGPELTRTPVTLGAAHLSLLSGSGELDELGVGNPPGWGDGDAFKLHSIHVVAQPTSLLSDHVVIDELDIEGPDFNYETKFVSSNIGQLLKNIEGSQNDTNTQAKTKSGEPKRFEIHHLVIKGGKITLAVAGSPAVVLPMPPIDFTDLGTSEGGVTSSQLAELIARDMLQSVAKSAIQGIGSVGKTGTGAVNDLLHSAKGLFGH